MGTEKDPHQALEGYSRARLQAHLSEWVVNSLEEDYAFYFEIRPTNPFMGTGGRHRSGTPEGDGGVSTPGDRRAHAGGDPTSHQPPRDHRPLELDDESAQAIADSETYELVQPGEGIDPEADACAEREHVFDTDDLREAPSSRAVSTAGSLERRSGPGSNRTFPHSAIAVIRRRIPSNTVGIGCSVRTVSDWKSLRSRALSTPQRDPILNPSWRPRRPTCTPAMAGLAE